MASDCEAGFLRKRHVPYSPPLGIQKWCLRQTNLSYEEDVKRSPLAARGWAAQERILSPRIVHFTARQIVWECASSWQFEASGKFQEHGSGQQQYRKREVQPFFTEGLQNFKDGNHPEALAGAQASKQGAEGKPSSQDSSHGRDIEYVGRFRAWHNCVDEFAWRALTVPSDKLPAIAGIARILDNGSLGHYLAGIWSRNIGAGLAWGSPHPKLTPAPSYRAPSWSWASVDGPVSTASTEWGDELFHPGGHLPEWAKRYELKLVDQHIRLREDSNPYMDVLEGSYIVVEGVCVSADEVESLEWPKYSHTLIYDELGAFCSNEDFAEFGKDKAETFVLALKGDPCNTLGCPAVMLLLKWTDAKCTTAQRIGMYVVSSMTSHEELDSLGWERKTLKLI